MHRYRSTAPCAGLAALAAGLLWPGALEAQYVRAPAPAAYALENVTLVQADGRRTEGVTVVVRGELIEAIGRNAAVPADAKVLEGESLHVYPGFVDAAGTAKLDWPEPEIDRRELESWAPPRDVQGFTPHRRVVDHLSATGADFGRERKRGVVAAAVHPHQSIMGGQGALLLLRPDARTPAELVARPLLGPAMAFQGGRGAYPSTLFGMIAFIRQSFEDARVHAARHEAHGRDPRGLTQPVWDTDHAVLGQAMNGGSPVYFAADNAEDIRRVLQLASEYGFQPVIVGGREAWKVADLLRSRNVPVIVSVDYGKPRRWKPPEPDPPAEEEEPGEDPEAAEPEEGGEADDPGESLDPAVLREKQDFENRYANAGRLAQAGVRFALASGGTADLREGARKAVEYGLGEEAALRALTATPASLLGAPHLTRVEAGMPATFLVATGPLFEKDTRIAYTFVEGALERGEEPGAPDAPADPDAAVELGGTWEITFTIQDMRVTSRMRVHQDGNTFRGVITGEFGEIDIRDGRIDGNQISFEAIQMGQAMRFTGTVDGDNVSGSGSIPEIGTIRFTGRRTGPGEAVR